MVCDMYHINYQFNGYSMINKTVSSLPLKEVLGSFTL